MQVLDGYTLISDIGVKHMKPFHKMLMIKMYVVPAMSINTSVCVTHRFLFGVQILLAAECENQTGAAPSLETVIKVGTFASLH